MMRLALSFAFAAVAAFGETKAPADKAASADSAKAYWHEKSPAATDSFYQNWMARLPDSTRVNDVSIPGTHDTMACQGTVLLKDIMLTQSMTLAQQLRSGLRYCDIRLCYEGSYFEIYHNFVDLGATLDDVLTTIGHFLKQHPSEFIVMRMQQERGDEPIATLNELLADYVSRPWYADLFYQGDSTNPTVGELRGKIFVLAQQVSLPGAKDYYSVDCQDFFEFTTNWDLYKKWELIKKQLLAANSGNPEVMYMNHLTGARGSMPYFVASGKASPGTNAIQLATGLLTTSATNHKYPDFPTKNLLFGVKEIDFMGTNQLTADFIEATQNVKGFAFLCSLKNSMLDEMSHSMLVFVFIARARVDDYSTIAHV